MEDINSKKLALIEKIIAMTENDMDVLNKMEKAYDFAYANRTFYIADIELDKVKNNGEIVMKTGWTRGTVKGRFSDKRNGYVNVVKVHKEYHLNAKLAEELNNYINSKFACGKEGVKHDYTGKTETIDSDEHPINRIINACNYFIKKNESIINARGKIN